jgi:hypothetical protein
MPERTTKQVEPDFRARLQGLARYVSIFTAPSFNFGTWHTPRSDTPGTEYLAYFVLSYEAQKFVQMAYDMNWVVQFDWPTWKDTPAAAKLWENPERISEASADDLARVLTVWIRGDRFCEGALSTAFESGVLTAIVKRAAALLEELPS